MRLTASMISLLESAWAVRARTQCAEAKEVLRRAHKRTVRTALKQRLLGLRIHGDGNYSLMFTPLSTALMKQDGKVDHALLLPPYRVRLLALFAAVYPSSMAVAPSFVGNAVWPGYRKLTSAEGYGMKAANAMEKLKADGMLADAPARGDAHTVRYRITGRGLTALRMADDAEFVDWSSDSGPRKPGRYWYRKNRCAPILCLVSHDGRGVSAVTVEGLGSAAAAGIPIHVSTYNTANGVEWSFTEAKPLNEYRRPGRKVKCQR